MLSTTTVAVVLLSGIAAAQSEDTTHSREMGPAAFMWPPDRPWSAEADNIPPCGSSSGVGNRTEFPLANGRLALVTQNETSGQHIGVSYLDNPTKIDDFEIFYRPTQLDPVLDVGHTCILAPNPPTNVTAGSNATFMFFYMEDGGAETSPFWACTDITYVDTAAFDESIPCFNATRENPDVSTDGSVSVTTTAPDGSNPHPELENDGDDGLSGGAIAGAVIGSLAGAALILAGAFFLWRRSRKSKAAVQPSMQQVEKAMSDKSSQ